MDAQPKAVCVVCRKRTARFLRKLACRKCAVRTKAEGTREQFGLPDTKSEKQRTEKFIRTYNKVAAQGGGLKDIAAALEREVQTVKNEARLLRRMGVRLEPIKRSSTRVKPPGEPLQRATRHGRANEHGGGKCGVTGCECLPCQQVRRANRRAWNVANAVKVRSYQRTYEQRKAKPS